MKDTKWASDHHLAKFDRSVVVNLKPISYYFGVYITWFLIHKLLELVKSSFGSPYPPLNANIICESSWGNASGDDKKLGIMTNFVRPFEWLSWRCRSRPSWLYTTAAVAYHFHIVYEWISMLPSFSACTIDANWLYILTSIQICQGPCKNLNSIVHQRGFGLENE